MREARAMIRMKKHRIVKWHKSAGGTGLVAERHGEHHLLRKAGGGKWNLHLRGKEYGPFPSLAHAKVVSDFMAGE
jgi:hypothetical protein